MKTPLIERMTKGGAAKAWIKEVEAKDRELERLEQTKDQYLNTINLLACEKEQLEAELEEERYAIEQYRIANNGLAVSKDILEAKLTAIECSDCGLTMLVCECDDLEDG